MKIKLIIAVALILTCTVWLVAAVLYRSVSDVEAENVKLRAQCAAMRGSFQALYEFDRADLSPAEFYDYVKQTAGEMLSYEPK